MPPQSTPASSSSPIYKSHPLYSFRRLIIISVLIGVPLTAISAAFANVYTFGVWLFGLFALIASGLLALADLLIWAHRKQKEDVARHERDRGICRVCSGPIGRGEDGNVSCVAGAASSAQGTLVNMITRADDGDDDEPKWPVRWIMISDFLLTGILFWMLLYEVAVSDQSWYNRYSSGSSLVSCYATVPMGFAFVLHARCWWRQFRARERAAWIRGLGPTIVGTGGVGDIETGIERSVHPYVHDRGHDLGPNFEGHDMHGSGNTNQTPLAVQKRNGLADSVKETVKEFNRDAAKMLTSKVWLPDRSNTGERQSLLSHNERAHTGQTQYSSGRSERCACSRPQVSGSIRPQPNSTTYVNSIHGCADNAGDDTNGTSNDAQGVKSAAADRTSAYLTPNDSGVTSAGSGASSSSSQSHESRVCDSKKEIGDETDIEEDEMGASSNLLSHVDKPLRVADGDSDKHEDDDDADIMVVKKSKKGKARVQKQRKGKSREVEGEE